MKYKWVLTFSVFLLASNLYGLASPKREMRAVWVATAAPDFPISSTTSGQMNEIITLLDEVKSAGFNTVIFQVRPGCDAFYQSSLEPWSHLLTGTSGQAPDPFYDPLQFFIEHAHMRGLELHAWFNPFRLTTGSLSALDASHVYHEHPDWKMDHSSKMLDPGKQVVRDYTVEVIMDVVNRYNIDGVHMDDYFYPYAGMNPTDPEDEATFASESRGFTDIEDWRRDNVNQFVYALYDSILSVKPWVKMGISPFGIWKSGTPSGIVGLSAYDEIYCDATAWLNAGKVDYIVPQLYWSFGGGQDYATLMPWWVAAAAESERHLYVGHGNYKIGTTSTKWPNGWDANEVPRQIRLNRQTQGNSGSVHFRLRNGLLDNPKGILDSLRLELYGARSLQPSMPWRDAISPNPPQNFTVAQMGDSKLLQWLAPQQAADGDSAYQFVIYRSIESPVNTEIAANILEVLSGSENSYTDVSPGEFHYAITALDRLKNESVAYSPEYDKQDAIILYSNYPNPFSRSTTLNIYLAIKQEVRLSVYDISGAHVLDLYSGELPAGIHSFQFDAKMADGNLLPTGVYIARFESRYDSQVQRMLLLK